MKSSQSIKVNGKMGYQKSHSVFKTEMSFFPHVNFRYRNSFKNKQAFCFIIKSLWIKDHWSDIIWLTMRVSYLWLSRNSGLYITKRTVEIDLLVQKLEVFYISDQNWLTRWMTYYTFLNIWVNKGNFNHHCFYANL